MGTITRVLLESALAKRGFSIKPSYESESTPRFIVTNNRTVKDTGWSVTRDTSPLSSKVEISFSVTTDLFFGYREVTITGTKSYRLGEDESIRTVTWDTEDDSIFPIVYLEDGTVYTPSGEKH